MLTTTKIREIKKIYKNTPTKNVDFVNIYKLKKIIRLI